MNPYLIRLLLLPIFLLLWAVGGIIMILYVAFESAFSALDRLLIKFLSWVNKISMLPPI